MRFKQLKIGELFQCWHKDKWRELMKISYGSAKDTHADQYCIEEDKLFF